MAVTARAAGIFSDIVTKNDKMFSIFNYIEAISRSNEPVLITGECGSGKELIARSIHLISTNRGRFVPVNIAGPDDINFSDTLFGHVRGAYTGSERSRKGLVERAAGGTLFLDEIGDLSPVSQVKLLRLIQEREYCPLGSDIPIKADVRMLFATNRTLPGSMKFEQSGNALFYRLNIHCINIPPLRERMEDLPLLINYFIEQACRECCVARPRLSPEVFRLLKDYDYPGNVRELRAIIFDAVCRAGGRELSLSAVKQRIYGSGELSQPDGENLAEAKCCNKHLIFGDELPTLKEVAEMLVDEALQRAGGKISLAAKSLGITHQALSKRLKNRKERRSIS